MNPVEDIVKPMLGFLCIYGFLFLPFLLFFKNLKMILEREKNWVPVKGIIKNIRIEYGEDYHKPLWNQPAGGLGDNTKVFYWTVNYDYKDKNYSKQFNSNADIISRVLNDKKEEDEVDLIVDPNSSDPVTVEFRRGSFQKIILFICCLIFGGPIFLIFLGHYKYAQNGQNKL